MKRTRLIAGLLLCLGLAPRIFAHGDMDHILGSVARMEGDLVVVEKDAVQVEVYLRPFTRYESAGHAAQRNDIRVGDRVVVHARRKDGKEEAYEFRYVHTTKR